MGYRTSAAEVKEIIDTKLTEPEIIPFIKVANLIVTEQLSDQTVMGSATLAEIERWLTAHILASSLERQPIREKIGETEVEYAKSMGKNLESTSYGQQVKLLDATGILSSETGKKQASIYAITSFE